MGLDQNSLLDGETIISSKNANSVIKLEEHGLSRFAFDNLMWTIGMKGKEAIGGKLHLTNYRLIFQSHSFNRLTGKFSIFLPTVRDVRDTSGFIKKQIEVVTGTQRFEFVAWGVPTLIAAIKTAADNVRPEHIEFLKTAAVSNYEKIGDGLQVHHALEAINVGILTAQKLTNIVQTAKTQFEASSVLNLLELLSDK